MRLDQIIRMYPERHAINTCLGSALSLEVHIATRPNRALRDELINTVTFALSDLFDTYGE